jgi:hypothetical protein
VKGNQLEDREIEEWARMILEEATLLVELLGQAENARHLVRDNGRSGILVDQWTQPPLFNTDDIATDDRRLEMRSEVQSLEPRLKQAFVLVRGMRRGLERVHERWKGDH